MTNNEMKALQTLRKDGHSVVVFTPRELEGAHPEKVEDRLVELGWDVINSLKEKSK